MRLLLNVTTALACLLAGLGRAEALVLAGSDLLGEPVREALQAELQKDGLDIDFSLEGSLLGVQALEAGNSDACILAVPDGQGEVLNLRNFPVAFQIVTFMVNSTSPVTEISYTQLAGLFGAKGTLDGWSSLTGNPDWASRKVSLWATRSENSIALEIFNAMVIGGGALKPTVRYVKGGDEAVLAVLVDDASALVVAPATFRENPAVRILAVKSGTERQAFTPSPDNVLFGDYPLRLPFHLVFKDGLSDEVVAKLVRAIYSPAVTTALQESSWMPIPETERRTILNQYD